MSSAYRCSNSIVDTLFSREHVWIVDKTVTNSFQRWQLPSTTNVRYDLKHRGILQLFIFSCMPLIMSVTMVNNKYTCKARNAKLLIISSRHHSPRRFITKRSFQHKVCFSAKRDLYRWRPPQSTKIQFGTYCFSKRPTYLFTWAPVPALLSVLQVTVCSCSSLGTLCKTLKISAVFVRSPFSHQI